MMRAFPCLVLAIGLLTPVAADHCEGYTTSQPDVAVADHYVDVDCIQNKCVFSVWVYAESNGIPGLQRGDEVTDDTCHGSIQADTIIF